jgi:hypothetical protein
MLPIFIALKNLSSSAKFEPMNFVSSGQDVTTGSSKGRNSVLPLLTVKVHYHILKSLPVNSVLNQITLSTTSPF